MENNSIFAVEQLIFNEQYQEAFLAIHKIFMGFRQGHRFATTTDATKIEPELISVYTRFANCLCSLFLNYNKYKMDTSLFSLWLGYAREIRAIFTIGGFYRTDFLIGLFDIHFKDAISRHSEINNNIAEIEQCVFRMFLFNMLENETQPDFKLIFNFFPDIVANSILSLLSSLVVVTVKGSETRERLFDLFPLFEKYHIKESINLLDVSVVWMLCSYVTRRDKHAVKYYLNMNIRSWLKEKNVLPKTLPYKAYNPQVKKPTILVVLEYFRSWHSMGRSYGDALKNLREKFQIVGVAIQSIEQDDEQYEIFDKVIVLECYSEGILIDTNKLRNQLKKIERLEPDVVFYPSLGMHQTAIVLANIRLAPIQIISFGHPASSFCDTIDYGIIEADYAPASDELFSEKLILLPPESFVSNPLGHMPNFSPKIKTSEERLFIGISSSLPKMSASFLQVCKKISEESKRRVMFLFFLNETEVFYLQCKKDILDAIPEAQVLHRLPPHDYINHLTLCDLYLSTFPFGGANSVIDAMCVGLPVVCLRGDDIAGRTDSALISRRGLPDWLITTTEEEYITAALRLIHNDEERMALAAQTYECSKELTQENNPNYQQLRHCFSDAVWHVFQKHQLLQQSSQRSFSLDELISLN